MTTLVLFVSNLFIWAFTRNYVFTKFVIKLYINRVPAWDEYWNPWLVNIYCFTGGNLCMLHYYWLYMLIQIVVYYAKKGKAEDLINNSSKQVQAEMKAAAINGDKKQQ